MKRIYNGRKKHVGLMMSKQDIQRFKDIAEYLHMSLSSTMTLMLRLVEKQPEGIAREKRKEEEKRATAHNAQGDNTEEDLVSKQVHTNKLLAITQKDLIIAKEIAKKMWEI